MGDLGRVIVGLGVLLVVLGAAMMLVGKVPWIGHLPGDIHIERERFSLYVPIVTCLVVSVIATIVVNLVFRR